MTPIKIEIDIDDMGVSAALFKDGKQPVAWFAEHPITPVEIAFKIRELIENHT